MTSTLLLSGSVPPGTTGSAIIVGNLAKQFSRGEMVVAGYRPPQRPAVEWQSEWPEIHYIAGPWRDGARAVRWRRRLWLGPTFARALRLARAQHCTAVLTVYPPEEMLLVGLFVARCTGAAYLPYFHNTYLEQRTGVDAALARRLQPRVFAAARHVFVMSDGMAELYVERYPEIAGRCSALVHTFGEAIPAYEPAPEPGPELRFALSGNIHEICLDAARRMCRAALETPGGRLSLLGSTQRPILAAEGWLQDGIEVATVSRDELIPRLRAADVLLLPHGFGGSLAPEEYATVFPTRTIEYLLAMRPILAHAPADCYLSRFIRETGCALLVDRPELDALREGIRALRTDGTLRARLVRNALVAAERFQPGTVAGHLRSAIAGHLQPTTARRGPARVAR